MLNKKRTASWARLRLLLVLPLAGAMLCTSTMAFTKEYGYVDLLQEKSEAKAPIQENPKAGSIKKQDQVRFWKKNGEKNYFLPSLITGKDGKIYSREKRFILINGKKVIDISTFYGLTNADKIINLDGSSAIKKYGSNAKFGAVEIIGKNIYLLKSAAEGPPPPTISTVKFPPPKQDQVRFPPPIIRPDRNYFYARRDFKSSVTSPPYIEKRYILVDGQPITDTTFYGAVNTQLIKYLSPKDAISKYGDQAKYGAIEITGGKISYLKPGQTIPLPPKQDQVKFPPPIVKPDKPRKALRIPPPPAAPETKTIQIKMVERDSVDSKKKALNQTTKNNEHIKAEVQKEIELQLKEVASKSNKN